MLPLIKFVTIYKNKHYFFLPMNVFVTPILICNFTDCASPLLVPLWGNKVYASVGLNSVRLAWHFDTDGLTIKEVELKYVHTKDSDITVARQQPGQQLQVNSASGYANRIIFTGSLKRNKGTITFAILNVTKSDRRTFKCDLSFNSFDPPDVQSSVELILRGKYLTLK